MHFRSKAFVFLSLCILFLGAAGCSRDGERGKRVTVPEVPLPETDNDRDGIENSVDTCPWAAEDIDGFDDLDGCPDPDNDRDGVPDALDACPNTPGQLNNSGCPLLELVLSPTSILNRLLDLDHGDSELKGGEGGVWPRFRLVYSYYLSSDRTAIMAQWQAVVSENKGDGSTWSTSDRHVLARAPRGQKIADADIDFNRDFTLTDEARGHGEHTATMESSGDHVGHSVTYTADQVGRDTPRIVSITFNSIAAQLSGTSTSGDMTGPLEFEVQGQRVQFDRETLEEIK